MGQFWISKKGLEHLGKYSSVLPLANHDAFQRCSQIIFALKTYHHGRRLRQGNARAVHGHASTSQRPPKGGDVVGQFASSGVTELHETTPFNS
jgi:hypothetical protein